MSRERFHYLIERYKDNILSQEEWDELRPMLQSGAYDEFLKEDILLLMRPLERRASPVRRLVRVMAVAAALLLCVGSVWLLRPSRGGISSVRADTLRPVGPGGDKAVLTLASGQRIILDSVPNGKIATQGAATVVRAGGLIGYEDTGGEDVLYNTVTTPKGGQYVVALADGSKVWLNSASSLRFPTSFKGGDRRVELTGEGYFEIAKDAARPFFVEAGPMNVQVLGTRFDVMAYPDEATINTTLVEGAVAVREGQQVHQPSPGEQVALGAGHRMAVGRADIEKTLAWKNGLFEFDRMDLAAIMRQIARWYDVEVVYQSPPDATPLGGSISKRLGLQEVLALLEASGQQHFRIEGRRIIITQTK